MTSPRELETRLDAWRGFRDVAHATRSLAAAQVLRWTHHAREAGRHLAWVAALHGRARDLDERRAGPPVVLALGTDLGLCGRLNQTVADEVRGLVISERPALLIACGVRLVDLLGDVDLGVDVIAEPTPSSIEAAAELADRVEAEVVAVSGPFAPRLTIVGIDDASPAGTPIARARNAPPHEELDEAQSVASRLDGRQAMLLTESVRLANDATSLLIHARVAHAVCLAARVEASVRLQTMTRAHEAAEDRITEQERDLRKARQETITQEMLEVTSSRTRGRSR